MMHSSLTTVQLHPILQTGIEIPYDGTTNITVLELGNKPQIDSTHNTWNLSMCALVSSHHQFSLVNLDFNGLEVFPLLEISASTLVIAD
jgi:hypothetical protein